MMDTRIGWFQPEHEGIALETWMRVWRTANYADNNSFLNTRKQTKIYNKVDYKSMKSFSDCNDSDNSSSNLSDKLNVNPASTFNLNEKKFLITKYKGTPWRRLRKGYSYGIDGLNEEIEDFYVFMSGRPAEETLRESVYKRISKVITDELPDVQIDFFGSFRTGLYLPTSDIDIVIYGKWSVAPYFKLKQSLIEKNITTKRLIKVLDRASIPIIKLVDLKSNIKINISFNTEFAVPTADLIKKYIDEYPCLAKLVLVLKHFLIQRDMNEVYTGGISSYAITLMVISFLQLHPSVDTRSTTEKLGQLLIEFFELYGRLFNYYSVAIRIKDGGRYVAKKEIERQIGKDYRANILCIEDPANPLNDVTKSTYGIVRVKEAFEFAYHMLQQAVGPLSRTVNQRRSILGRIIRVTDVVVDLRNKFRINFRKKHNNYNKNFSASSDRITRNYSNNNFRNNTEENYDNNQDGNSSIQSNNSAQNNSHNNYYPRKYYRYNNYNYQNFGEQQYDYGYGYYRNNYVNQNRKRNYNYYNSYDNQYRTYRNYGDKK